MDKTCFQRYLVHNKKIIAWILTLVMAASVLMAVPAKQVEAEETEVDLTFEAGEQTVEGAVTQWSDGQKQADISINKGTYSTLNEMHSAGAQTLQVEVKVISVTPVSGTTPKIQPYVNAADNWTGTQTNLMTDGEAHTYTHDVSALTGSGELYYFGIQFSNIESITYEIVSAKLILSDSGSSGSGSGETDWEVENDKITLSYTSQDLYNDYTEYYFSVNNDNMANVSGDLQVTFEKALTLHWPTEDSSISVSGKVLTVSGLNISANDISKKIQVQLKPLGNTITSVSFGGSTIGIGEAKTEDVELNYDFRGKQEKELADTPFGKHGQLSLSKIQGYGNAPVIVDEHGKAFRLRGASMHGMHWFPTFASKETFQGMRDDFGANMIRLVCYPKDNGGGYLTSDTYKDSLDNLIVNGVDYCEQLGMYAMVDWHVHNWNPNDELEAAKTFFTKYANLFKDKKHVIYEICNEPSSIQWYNGSSTDLYTYCNTIVSLIRSIDDDALIVCGTGCWSQWVDQVADKPINDGKVLYTLHFYSGTHKASELGATMVTAINAGTPVFITEFGVCDASGNGGYNLDEADKWEALMEKYNVSCACWSCSNCDESASYFNPGTSATANWKASDFTKTGQWLFNTYRKLEEEEVDEVDDPATKTVLKDSDITFPTASSITYGQTLADSELSKTSDTYGTYAWKTSATKPDAGTAEYDVVYTPKNTKEYDYSGLTGYDATSKKVVRKVSVTVNKKEITSVTFPTVTAVVTSQTVLSEVALSKKSDDYGTFAWASPTTVVKNDTTGAEVVYTLKDADNYKIASTVTGVNEDGTTVTRKVSFTVKKAYADTDVPVAPTLKAKTATTVTLNTYAGEETIQYGVKKGTDDYTWQSSPSFTGLSPWTIYTFALRYADLDNYVAAGKAGAGLEVVTYLSDEDKYTVAISEFSSTKAAQYIEAHNGTIEYDEDTKTLTLLEDKEYTILGVGEDITIYVKKAASIYMGPANFKKLIAEDDLTIELCGYNTISEGINVLPKDGSPSGTLTIRNEEGVVDGSLTVGEDTVNGIVTAYKLYVVSGSLVVSSTADAAVKSDYIYITGGEMEVLGAGDASIDAVNVSVEEGKLTAKGTGNAAGIKADKVIIGGGTVNVTGAGDAAAITTKGAENGEVDLYGGNITVNNSSETVRPVESDRIIYDGAVVHSNSDSWYSSDPVDRNGDSVTFKTVTYNVDGVETKAKVTVNSEITLGKADDKSGYKFDGWYKNDDTTLITAGTKETVTADVKYTAVYSEITGSLSISVPDNIPILKEGYTDEGVTITVANKTNVSVENIAVSLNGIDKSRYTIDKSSITDLQPDESESIKLILNSGLTVSGSGYSVNVVIANSEVSPKTETVQVTRKVYLNNENSFKVDVSKLNDADYIEVHNGTISYKDDVLTLENEGTYTITGENDNLIVKVKDGNNGDNVSINLEGATVKDIQGTNNITKDNNSKIISKENGNNPVTPDPETPVSPKIEGEITVTREPYMDPIKGDYRNAVVKFTVKNDSNIKLGSIDISLAEGEDSAQYSLSDSKITDFEIGAAKEISLSLKEGLPAKAEGYKATVVITNKELDQQINLPVVRRVYLSDEDSRVVDVSKLDEPGYVEIHNGLITYEKTTDENGETTVLLNLEDETEYTIIGANAAVIVKAKKENTTVNLNDATVKDVQGTTIIFLDGTSSLTASEDGKGEENDNTTPTVKAQGINVGAKVKGVNDLPVSGTMKLAVKKSLQLSVSFTPEGAVKQSVTYTSSNPKIASVSAAGKITAKKAGKTTIIVKSAEGLTKVFKLQVMKKPVKKVKIKASKKTVKVGKTIKVKAVITPDKKLATTNVYWKSSNSKIATVTSKGIVKGVKKGKVKITAIATDGSGKKATLKIQVK